MDQQRLVGQRLVGKRIRKLRKARELSQEQLAERVGTSPKYLSRIETGRENPTLDLLLRLARGLKVEPYEILQFHHEGETPRRLRMRLASLLREVKEADLARLAKILEALVH